jgi:phosphinothricin tripeptide acetyl hydrolase
MTGTIEEKRSALEGALASAQPPPGVEVRPTLLGGRPAEWITPHGGREDAAVLYLHGGGYCIGSLGTHRDLAARLAIASGCVVVTLDYRLAPEHPFPAGLDDARAAFAELTAGGIPPQRLAIAGDSAGGGLTMATLLALRDGGETLPAAAACLSPWVDLTLRSPAFDRLADLDPVVDRAGLEVSAAAYLDGVAAESELASPLFAADLGGLPPIRIEVGEHEVLLDDSLRLADRIRSDGGTVSITVWPELIHVFQAFPPSLVPEADQSIAGVGSFLADHLAATD